MTKEEIKIQIALGTIYTANLSSEEFWLFLQITEERFKRDQEARDQEERAKWVARNNSYVHSERCLGTSTPGTRT